MEEQEDAEDDEQLPVLSHARPDFRHPSSRSSAATCSLIMLRARRTSSIGIPQVSGISQRSTRAPGQNGQVSPQPIETK